MSAKRKEPCLLARVAIVGPWGEEPLAQRTCLAHPAPSWSAALDNEAARCPRGPPPAPADLLHAVPMGARGASLVDLARRFYPAEGGASSRGGHKGIVFRMRAIDERLRPFLGTVLERDGGLMASLREVRYRRRRAVPKGVGPRSAVHVEDFGTWRVPRPNVPEGTPVQDMRCRTCGGEFVTPVGGHEVQTKAGLHLLGGPHCLTDAPEGAFEWRGGCLVLERLPTAPENVEGKTNPRRKDG